MVGNHEIVVLDQNGDIDWVDPLHIVSLKSLSGRKNGKAA